MAYYKSYQIFNGDVHVTTISAKTKAFATAYFCGMVEGYRVNNNKTVLTMLSENGDLIHTKRTF